jgi:hypothetical protein
MLPAISSDLPAYLLPPTVGEEGRRTTSESYGPADRVDISTESAVDAQSVQPGTGLYGPDGQFVDSAARRELQNGSQSQPAADQPSSDAAGDTAPSQPQALETPSVLSSQSQEAEPERDLALDNFDAAIPPAAREELRSLADRVERKSTERALSPDEYKKMAALMMRVGRHPDAMRALTEAQKLEQAGQPEVEIETPSILTEAGVE